MESELRIGETIISDAQKVTARGGNMADTIMSQLHGRYYELNRRGRLFAFGISSTALSTNTAIATAVDATAKPIVALWNPSSNTNDLEILAVWVHETVIANTAVATGGYMWLYSANNPAVTTGSNPINCRTFASPGGSVAKVFAVSTALTGMANNLAVIRPTSFFGINAAGPGTAIPQPQGPGFEMVDGGLIVSPGSVVAIMNQLSTTTVSVNAGILWAEVPKP